MAEYKGKLLKGVFTKATKCLLSDGVTSVESKITTIEGDMMVVNYPQYGLNSVNLKYGSAIQFSRDANNKLTGITFYNSDGTTNSISI